MKKLNLLKRLKINEQIKTAYSSLKDEISQALIALPAAQQMP